MVSGGSGGDSSELRDDTIVSSVHYKQTDGSHMNNGNVFTLNSGIFNNDFHIVSMIWDANYIYYSWTVFNMGSGNYLRRPI